MPTLRGHEGSKARVAARPRSSELISTDELHRIVDNAHASAWKDGPSRAHPVPPDLAAATQEPPGAASARPPLEARSGARSRRNAAASAAAEAAAPWSGLAAPVPASVSLSQPIASPVAPPLSGEEPRASGALRRIAETILVIFSLALLALGRPELAELRDSLGLDLSLEVYAGSTDQAALAQPVVLVPDPSSNGSTTLTTGGATSTPTTGGATSTPTTGGTTSTPTTGGTTTTTGATDRKSVV
jgi:hypothetical protein